MRRYLTLRQVAERLGKTPAWMYDHIKRLQASHGFPARDAAMGGWDEGSIAAWQNARLPPELRAALAPGSKSPGAEPPAAIDCLPAMLHLEQIDDVDIAAELDRRALALFAEAAP